MSITEFGELIEAFQESGLPFRVDVLDWHAISPEFRQVIKRKYEVLKVKKNNLAMVTTGFKDWTEKWTRYLVCGQYLRSMTVTLRIWRTSPVRIPLSLICKGHVKRPLLLLGGRVPVSDLRNYNEVLRACQDGEPVFITKNGRGKYSYRYTGIRKTDTPFPSRLFTLR